MIQIRPTLKRQMPYNTEDVFSELINIIPQLKGFSITGQDKNSYSINARRKSGITVSGSNIRISLFEQPNGMLHIEMEATPVVPTQMFDIGDSMVKSMEQIMDALSQKMCNYTEKQINKDKNEASTAPTIAQELRDLAMLRDDGIISDEEFNAKKKQLLNI